MRNRVNITILNGTVRGFVDDGIADNFSGDGRNHRIVNVRAINNGSYGILLNGSGFFSVTGCIAEGNGEGGIFVSKDSTVTGSRANNNGSHGIATGTGSLTKGNSANGNTDSGIFVISSGSVIGNTANNNGELGINLSGAGFLVEGNSASGNTSGGISNCGSCVYGVNFGVIP
jgi:parallel beta-helix repeat protein